MEENKIEENVKDAKKAIKGWLIILFIICAIACPWVIRHFKNNEAKVDYDYSDLAYEDVFYKDFKDIYNPATKTSVRPEFSNSDIGVRIIIIDENLNPITEAKVKFYDTDKYYIATLSPNKNGIIAINNFPKDFVVNFEQTETRNGLKKDETTYLMKNQEVKQLRQFIINSEKDLSDEEKEQIKQAYIEKHKVEHKNEGEHTENITEENSEKAIKYSYRFVTDDLKGYKINVNVERIGTVGEDENKFQIAKCSINIPSAEIKKVELIEQQDSKQNAEILDLNLKPKNTFENGESFYLKYKSKSWMERIFYNANITFKLNEKEYKVCKRNILNVEL